jgi:hypothetical protein
MDDLTKLIEDRFCGLYPDLREMARKLNMTVDQYINDAIEDKLDWDRD